MSAVLARADAHPIGWMGLELPDEFSSLPPEEQELPYELSSLPFELQLLCVSHVQDGRDLAALRAAASWATAVVDGAASPLPLFAWHLRERRARASARSVHVPRGKPRFVVLRAAHALRLIGGMQTPGLCCGHRQQPIHEHTIAGAWAACCFGIRHTVCVRADGVAVGYGQGWSFLEGGMPLRRLKPRTDGEAVIMPLTRSAPGQAQEWSSA